LVERFFLDLSANGLRFGVFHSLLDIITFMEKHLAQHKEA